MYDFSGKRKKRTKKRFCETKCSVVKQVLRDFVENSSIHGVKYLGNFVVKTNWIGKLVWTWTLIFGFTGAGFMLKEFLDRYNNNPIRRVVDTVYAPSWTVPFPAVTICPIAPTSSKQRLKLLKRLKLPPDVDIRDANKLLTYANILLLPYRGKTVNSMKLSDIMELNHLSIMNLSSSLRLPCKDVVKSCWWQKTKVNCEKIFRRSYSAYGPCCSFNYLLEDRIEVERTKMEKPNPVRTAYFGEHFGLSFVINRNQFVDEERNNDIPESAVSTFSGLIIMTHNSFDYPSEKVGYIVVEPGHEFQLRMKVLREKLTPEVFSMSEERRDCVIENERILEYFPEYRHLNCFVECRINVTLEVCGCIPFYYAPLLKEKMNQICDLKGNSCISRSTNKIWNLLFNAGGNRTRSCSSCPDLCENVNYLSQHSEYSISEKRFTSSPLYQNLTSEETVIKVYLASQVYTTMSIISIADGIYILSSLGGVFSLFLGCSFLTMIEVLYFIGLFLREFLSNRNTQTGFTVSR